eukprot:gene5783-6483_t
MGLYAIGIKPLLNLLKDEEYLDEDFTGIEKIKKLRKWWDNIVKLRPSIGYFPKVTKRVLIVNNQHLQEAIGVFHHTGVQITAEVNRHLGAVVGSRAYKMKYVSNTMQRTVPRISNDLQPLKNAIRNHFIKALLNGYVCNDRERKLFALPVKYGGLAIFNPCERCKIEFDNSKAVPNRQTEQVSTQNKFYDEEVEAYQNEETLKILKDKRMRCESGLKAIQSEIDDRVTQIKIEASIEVGASSWLTTLPIKKYGFLLDKRSFWDSLHIRYNILLKRLPTTCLCGTPFNLKHALSCPKGGFISILHNS